MIISFPLDFVVDTVHPSPKAPSQAIMVIRISAVDGLLYSEEDAVIMISDPIIDNSSEISMGKICFFIEQKAMILVLNSRVLIPNADFDIRF